MLDGLFYKGSWIGDPEGSCLFVAKVKICSMDRFFHLREVFLINHSIPQPLESGRNFLKASSIHMYYSTWVNIPTKSQGYILISNFLRLFFYISLIKVDIATD